MFVLALCIISIVGCIGLTWGTPRPRNQEWWAIIAIAPVIVILSLAVLDAV